MPKIKVLMVLATTNIGGAEMFVLNLLKNMDLKRFHVDLAVSFKEMGDGISKEVRALGCNIYYLPYFKVYNYAQYVKAWDNFLLENHYDIVHGHASNSASIYLKVAKRHGCVTIAHCHSAGFRGNWLQRMVKRLLTYGVTKVADYWFACSEKAADHLYGKACHLYNNFYIIPNAINAEKYLYSHEVRHKIRQELYLSEDIFLCGHVGSLTAPKNHLFLLEIFAAVYKMEPKARLLLCGDGPLRGEIEDKSERLGIKDKVIFRGIVRNVNEYMMAMDVLVFPSIFEGFPITILEAEATGLPVVMSDVIPKEVDLTPNIYRMSLNDTSEDWALGVCEKRNVEREKMNDLISKSKYNMIIAVKEIMSLYDKMIRK